MKHKTYVGGAIQWANAYSDKKYQPVINVVEGAEDDFECYTLQRYVGYTGEPGWRKPESKETPVLYSKRKRAERKAQKVARKWMMEQWKRT